MSAAISQQQQSTATMADKNTTDLKNIDEVVKEINRIAEINDQKQVELNDISAKYISIQGQVSANNRSIAQLVLYKNKLETDLLKARIAVLEGSNKSKLSPTDEKQ